MRLGRRNGTVPRDHVVQLYENDDDLIEGVGGYLIDAIQSDEAAVVVATRSHADALRATVSAAGIDVDDACARGVVFVDAAQTLASFTVDGTLDPVSFDREIGGLIERAGRGGRRVRAFGEIVALLWDAGDIGAAIELEALWNELGERLAFSLYCAYPAQSVAGAAQRAALSRVCRQHSALVGAAATASSFDRLPGAPTEARRFVVETLEAWSFHDIIDDASLVTAELASNAVLHARTGFTVAVSARRGVVRISVHDQSLALPASRVPSSSAVSGRGLALVAALSRRWGTDVMDGGKLVWADLVPRELAIS